MTERDVTNAPIRGLQTMLQAIAFAEDNIPQVIPDGIYGASTEAAVSAFQRSQGLPVTGIADEATFRAIVAAFHRANELLSPAQNPVYLFPAELVVSLGQYHPHVRLAQAMLLALHQEFPGFSPLAASGILDAGTAENLRKLQTHAGTAATGALDKPTWNLLCRLYRGMFDRNLLPSQG